MNEIELIFPTRTYEKDVMEYYKEHILIGENTLHGDSGLDNAKSYDEWLEKINKDLNNEIHSIIFFAIRKCDDKLIGTINIRYPYENYVQIYGHIGYGVRPSERKKGYATIILKSALEYCKTLELKEILLTCDKSNIASAKVIKKCSGIFENEILQTDGNFLQRYWIKL